jgi:arylsulfatase A
MNTIHKILIIISFIAGYAYAAFGQKKTDQSGLPNVILIMADDIGYECLGAYGSTEYSTPHLDKLAQNGIRVTQCHAQPLCTPSRVKIMTGKYNFNNYEEFGYLNPNQTTFGNIMKQTGYTTCLAGKWQLNGHYSQEPGWQDQDRPYTFGFDTYCLWQLTKPKSEGERFANPLIIQDGEALERNPDAYGPDIFADYILDFIDQNKAAPFFVYYPMVLVHDPFVPTPDSETWSQPEKRYEKDTSYFKDMVAYADKIVGKIHQKLIDNGIEENTLIIFTGDNGTHPSIFTDTRQGTIQGGKGKMTDAGTRVPLIMHWPNKIKEPLVYDGMIEFSDFFPTLAETAGVKVTSDGQSFYNLISGKKQNPRETLLVHYAPKWGNNDKNSGRFVRTKEYKLYQDGRFYHVKEDVLEECPLHEEELTTAQLKIKKELQKVQDQCPEWK